MAERENRELDALLKTHCDKVPYEQKLLITHEVHWCVTSLY